MDKNEKVFIVNLPTKYDRATDTIVPAVDINAATDFGELVVVNHGRVIDDDGLEEAQNNWRKVRDDYRDEDYILTIGDVALLITATSDVMRRFGRVNLLRWNRELQSYRPQLLEWEWEMEDGTNG